MCVCVLVQANMCDGGLLLCVCGGLCFSGDVWNPYAAHLTSQRSLCGFHFGPERSLTQQSESGTGGRADVIAVFHSGRRRGARLYARLSLTCVGVCVCVSSLSVVSVWNEEEPALTLGCNSSVCTWPYHTTCQSVALLV